MNYIKILILIIFCFFSFLSKADDQNYNLKNKILKNVRCLVCQGQSIYDSQSDFAESLKIVINKKLDEGYNESQIYEYLKNQYGDWIIYDPKFSKNTFFLWLFPLLVFLVGGWLIYKKIKFSKL